MRGFDDTDNDEDGVLPAVAGNGDIGIAVLLVVGSSPFLSFPSLAASSGSARRARGEALRR